MEIFRTWFFITMYRIRIGNLLLWINRRKQRVPVLVFHKIVPEYDQIWPGIHPHLFEKIIVMLKRHYEVLPLAALHDANFDISRLKRACFITFDDGYKDFVDYAYPIMKRHRVFSALFVLPYQITNKGHIWTSAVVFFTKHYTLSEIDEFMRSKGQHVVFTNKEDAFKLNLDLTKHLCAMRHADRMEIIKALRAKFVADGRLIDHELLTFDELRCLDPLLVDVESHSLTHPGFRNEDNQDFITYEMAESKAVIEKELNVKVSAFAFPFANYNQLSINIAKRIYKLCFTGIDDFVDLNRLNRDADYRFDLPRFNIHHSSAPEVFFAINGFHRALLRRFSGR